MLEKLIEERARLKREAGAILDKAESEVRGLTPEENESVKRCNTKIDELNGVMEQRVNLMSADKAIWDPSMNKIPNVRTVKGEDPREALRSMANGQVIELRATTDPQTIGTAADGGYAVADQWYPKFVEKRKDANIMRQLASVDKSESGTMNVIAEDTNGVSSWVSENSEIAVAKETLTRVQFAAFKAARIVKVSAEMLGDSMFDFANYILRRIAYSNGILEEAGFVNGTNSGQPNGIFRAATSGVTAASQTAVTADELIDLFHSVGQMYRRDGVWLMADTTAKIIRKLKDGNQQYLWQPGLQSGQPDMLLGRPVYTTSYAPAMTAGLKPILFGWIGGYQIFDRASLEIQRLNELYAVNDLIGFKGVSRTDGDLTDTDSVRVLTMKA
ncbi:MAG: phage major capsid protein [Bryobacteraceae bacterium]